LALLELIKIYFGTGKIYKKGDSTYNYEVSSYKINNEIILPFFIKYPLPSLCLKATNFLIWKQIIEIMNLVARNKKGYEHRSELDELIDKLNK
jgi:hypothetical protein